MEEEQKQHLSVVNASGFPFQLAVAAQIRALSTPWRPILTEHPWRHPETNRDGYIDIVLENQGASSQRLVVECKRQRGDARWYFLDLQPVTSSIRYICSRGDSPTFLVEDYDFFPESPVARFCVIPGEGSSQRPTLERIADELLQSVEAFATEQLALDPAPWFQYLPVVLTTARLFLCSVNPTSISLATGELPADASFGEVPFLRFRKTLWSSSAVLEGTNRNLHFAQRERERTIVVVSAAGLHQFIRSAYFGHP
jgi:hypothetical protein